MKQTITPLAADEMETHFNQCADDRSKWECTTEDPVWIARLDKIAEGVPVGWGKRYILRDDQVLVRTGKRQLSPEAKQRMTQRLNGT